MNEQAAYIRNLRQQLRQQRQGMRGYGLRITSTMNGGLTDAEYRANRIRERLEAALADALRAAPTQNPKPVSDPCPHCRKRKPAVPIGADGLMVCRACADQYERAIAAFAAQHGGV